MMTSLTPPWHGGLIYFHGDKDPGRDLRHAAREMSRAGLPVVAVRNKFSHGLAEDREILTRLTGNGRNVFDNPTVEALVNAVRCRLNDK